MKALRADEIHLPGFIVEQIRAAIQQARICVADVTGTNPNVLYEIGYAEAVGKPIILLAEEGSELPFDVSATRVLYYGPNLENARGALKTMLRAALSDERLEEAERLLAAGHTNAAIAAAAVVLEQHLRSHFARWRPKGLDRMGLGQLVHRLEGKRDMDADQFAQLADVVGLRNKAVHQVDALSAESAKFVLRVVRDWIAGGGSRGRS